jgi:signal transduction histidine kinase
MPVENAIIHSKIHKAATAEFDFYNPAEALNRLLSLAIELLTAQRSAIYEYEEQQAGFTPRFSFGIPLHDLGHLGSATEQKILSSALSTKRATTSDSTQGSLGLPLSPGIVACSPCVAGGKTVGILFIAKDDDEAFDHDDLATLEVIATRTAEILTFAKQSSSQNYLVHRLSLLYQASHAITGTLNRDEAIRQMAAHVLKASSANYCDVLLIDETEQKPMRFHHQLEKSGLQTLKSSSIDTIPEYPIHKQIINEIEPKIISVVPPKGSSKDIAILQDEGFFTAAIFPLATGNQALGLLRLLYTKTGRVVHEQEIELAQAIANIGAVGIQDAMSIEEAKERANQLQVLADIGREMTSNLNLEVALENTMRHTQQVLQCEACILFLMDEETETLILKASGGRHMRVRDVSIRLEEGIAGWVARNQRPLIVNDVRTNPLYQSAIDSQTGLLTSSVLCVPLLRRDEILGVIEAINHPRGVFTGVDQQMLSSVASWAAIALDNANLFQSVAAERSRLETTLVETADSVVLTDNTGRIILVNQAAGQAFRINAKLASNRLASEIFVDHPLGEILMAKDIELPTNLEVTTPTDRILYTTVSEVRDVGRVAVMQDITALKQIDRLRSQLLGTAAHDLKNPLNAIRLGADLLNDAPLSDQQRKALYMMQRATDSMTNLITGLLETIRVESSANLIVEPCDINELIESTIADLRPLSDAGNHTIIYEPPDEPLVIKGDLNRLKSVINNLLSNAIKFTRTDGRIEINLQWDEERILIEVTDNGPGIPEDELPRIFEHLFRGRVTVQDPDNPIDGTGLGLALSKTVIEQHGGRIWVASEEGAGSTFSFTLPWEPTPKTGSLKKEN